MFTALMSLGLVALVVTAALDYGYRMDEMLSHAAHGAARRN